MACITTIRPRPALGRGGFDLRRGIVTIEAALVFPVLLLILFGVIELGWMLLKSQQLTNAARNGARVGVRVDATNGDVQQVVDALMTGAGMGSSGYTLTMTPGDVSNMNGGEELTVSLTVSYDAIGLGMPFVPTPEDLGTSVTMAKEGF